MTKRFETMLKAAEGGDVEAMNSVACVYARGDMMQPVDGTRAIMWYEKASSAGSGNALGNLAWLYLTGTFTEADSAKAVMLYERAIERVPGCDTFLYELGNCYERGVGAPRDKKRAVRLYRLAANAGSGLAKGALTRLNVQR